MKEPLTTDPVVYLCGPINGCTDAECKDWREEVKRRLPHTLDPMRRDYRGREEECYREIVELDKGDIVDCDVLLVNYSKPSVGTSMEILLAWEIKRTIVLWCAPDTVLSPWLRYHVTDIVHSLDEAIEVIRNLKIHRRFY